ncbi:hypothetical protein RQP46_008087 [Phenoliferia psychrophenolica]
MGSRSAAKGTADLLSPPSTTSLTRALSQPVLSSPPSAATNSRAPLGPSSSLPTLPLSPTKPRPPLARSSTSLLAPPPSSAQDASAPAPRGVAGARRTYGSQRSFKRDLDEERLFASSSTTPSSVPPPSNSSPVIPGGTRKRLVLPPVPPKVKERETYSALREKWGVDEEEELDEEVAEANQIKSVTQLRAKGENSRFVDELEYLLEGLVKGMALGVRRASAIEVLRKVLDPEFVRRLKSLGLVERVYSSFRTAEAGSGDRALDPALALLVATFAHDQRLMEPLLRISKSELEDEEGTSRGAWEEERSCDVLEVLTEMLLGNATAGEEVGSAVPGKGVSKSDVRAITSVRALIDESTLLADANLAPTLRSLALLAISLIASFAPRSIFLPQQLVCTSGALSSVVESFLREASLLPIRITHYSNGLDLLPPSSPISLPFLLLSLSTLESLSPLLHPSLPNPSYYSILSSSRSSLSKALSDVVLAAHIVGTGEAQKLVLASLRLMIELTNEASEWAEALVGDGGEDGIVRTLVRLLAWAVVERGDEGGEKEEEEKSSRFNVLCLALGVLTNLVETVPSVKDSLRDTHMSPLCAPTNRKCALACHCPGQQSSLHILAALYLSPLSSSQNELETSFVTGYTGMSLGLAMLDSPANQVVVIEALQDRPDKMEELLGAMDEFAEMHELQKKAEREETGEGDGDEDEGGEGSEVARGIRRMVEDVRARL